MKSFVKVILVCLLFGIPTHLIVKASFQMPPPDLCKLAAIGLDITYDSDDDVLMTSWNVNCVQGGIPINCTGAFILTVWEWVDDAGRYVPVGQTCSERMWTCGEDYAVYSVGFAALKGTYGVGSYKFTVVLRSGTCDNLGAVQDQLTLYEDF